MKCLLTYKLSLSLFSPEITFENTNFSIISRETKTEIMCLSLSMSLRIFVNPGPGSPKRLLERPLPRHSGRALETRIGLVCNYTLLRTYPLGEGLNQKVENLMKGPFRLNDLALTRQFVCNHI